MDFDLTKEQKMIRDEVRNFARKEIAHRAEELERTGKYPYDIIAKMAELGLMGIPFPEEYGGMGSHTKFHSFYSPAHRKMGVNCTVRVHQPVH